MTIPDISAAGHHDPRHLDLPDISLPDISLPDISIPDISLPDNASELFAEIFPNLDEDQIDCLVENLQGEIRPERGDQPARASATSIRKTCCLAGDRLRRDLARRRGRARAPRPDRARPVARLLRRFERRRAPPPAHYAAMAEKSAQGAEERDWRDVRPGVRDVDRRRRRRRRGGGRRARPHPHGGIVALADPRQPRRPRHARRRRGPAGRRVQRLRADRGGAAPLRRVPGRPGQRRRRACVVDSHVVGVAKPDPAIFDHAAVHFPAVDRRARSPTSATP